MGHRYIKVMVDTIYANSGWQIGCIAEFQALLENGTNVALGKNTTSSGYYTTGPEYAVDGSTSANGWTGYVSNVAPNGNNMWWQVDLGQEYDIKRFRIHSINASGGYGGLQNFRILGSKDNATWETILTVTGMVSGAQWNTFSLGPYSWFAQNGRDFTPISTNSSTGVNRDVWIYATGVGSSAIHGPGSGSYAAANSICSVYDSQAITGFRIPDGIQAKNYDIYIYGRSYSSVGVRQRVNGGSWYNNIGSYNTDAYNTWNKIATDVPLKGGDLFELGCRGGGATTWVFDVYFVEAGLNGPTYTPTGKEGYRTSNTPPSITASVNADVIIKDTVVVTMLVVEPEGQQLQYRVLINDVEKYPWTALAATPVNATVNFAYSYFNAGSNKLTVEAKDANGASSTKDFTIIRKPIDITQVSQSQPTKNFNYAKTLHVGTGDTVLALTPYDKKSGFLKVYTLILNIQSGTGGIKIAPILNSWDPNIVTYNSTPNFDTGNAIDVNVTATGTLSIDISAIMQLIYDMGNNYGVAIYSPSGDITINIVGCLETIVYQATRLGQPYVVYGNRVTLTWEKPVLKNPSTFLKYVIKRSTAPDMSGAETITEITDKEKLHYMDETITQGQYYYIIEVHLAHNAFSGNQLDFDFADEAKFAQEDGTKTEFAIDGSSQYVRLTKYVGETKNIDFSDSTGFGMDSSAELSGGKLVLKTLV